MYTGAANATFQTLCSNTAFLIGSPGFISHVSLMSYPFFHFSRYLASDQRSMIQCGTATMSKNNGCQPVNSATDSVYSRTWTVQARCPIIPGCHFFVAIHSFW